MSALDEIIDLWMGPSANADVARAELAALRAALSKADAMADAVYRMREVESGHYTPSEYVVAVFAPKKDVYRNLGAYLEARKAVKP